MSPVRTTPLSKAWSGRKKEGAVERIRQVIEQVDDGIQLHAETRIEERVVLIGGPVEAALADVDAAGGSTRRSQSSMVGEGFALRKVLPCAA